MTRFETLLDELSSVPPREFTRARTALAARLTGEGRGDDAKKVKALRAPPLPLWATNRLAREHPDLARRLVAAAERVRDAQLGRAGAGGLAPAMADYRDAVDALVRGLDPLLAAAHVSASPAMRLRIRNTLMGAAADPELRTRLLTGRLEEELAAPGFELFAGAPPAHRARDAGPTPTEIPLKAPGKAAAGERRAAEREEQHRRAVEAREECQRRAAEARAAAEREREAAEERLRPLREAVARASDELEEARSAARRAAEAVTAAERRKRDAEQALRMAQHGRS